jgi:hypothetical protein
MGGAANKDIATKDLDRFDGMQLNDPPSEDNNDFFDAGTSTSDDDSADDGFGII